MKRNSLTFTIKKSKFGIFIFSFKKSQTPTDIVTLVITPREWKRIFFSNGLVYHFYPKKSEFNKLLEKYQKYSKMINYPINFPLYFDNKKLLKVEKFVNGQKLDDCTQALKLLLQFGINACKINQHAEYDYIFDIFDPIYYIQHGDVSKNNAFLISETNGLIFIDWDTIGVYPALFDFFRLLIRDEVCFYMFLEGYFDNDIMILLKEYDKKQLLIKKDFYFYAFLAISKFGIPSNMRLPHEYSKTLSLLKNN